MKQNTAIAIATARVCDLVRDEQGLIVLAAPPGFAKSAVRDQLLRDNPDARLLLAQALDREIHGAASVVLEWPDLQLTINETIELAEVNGVAATHAADIHRITNGWPEFTDALIESCASTGRPPSSTSPHRGPRVDELTQRCLANLSDSERLVFGQLAHFDRFSPRMIELLDADLDRLAAPAKGLPVLTSPSGWSQIAEPVRSHLIGQHPLSADVADSLAPLLLQEEGVVGAARMLVRAGQPNAAASIIRQTSLSSLEETDLDESEALLRLVTDLVKDDGSLNIRLGRVLHLQGSLENATQALRSASELAGDQLRTEVQLHADVELLLVQLPELSSSVAAARHEELAVRAGSSDAAAIRVRLREIEALLTANLGDLPSVYRSATMFQSVAREWTMLREPSRAASTLRVMTAAPLIHLGRYIEGRDAMESACDLVADSPRSLAMSRELLGRMCALGAELDRFDEILPEIDAALADVGDGWRRAYHAWSQMIAASLRGAADEVKYFHRSARSQLGDLLNHPTAAVFFAESAVALAMVNDGDALDVLAEATNRAAASPLDVGLAQISVNALVGDPTLVPGLANHARSTLDVPAERDWRVELDLLFAAARADNTKPSTSEVATIREEAGRWGLGALADALIDARTPRTYQGNTNISLLGGFQSCVNGESVELPPGHVRGLVKLLAVRSRPITTDVAVDHLWPDVSLDVGRRRLKNVVSRIRTRLGPDAIHRTSATVALGDHVRVDVRQFVSAADRVGQAGRASEAVNLYAGPLLPEDLYEDWVDPIRHSLADRALNLTLQAMLQESPDAGWLVGSLRRIGPPTEESWLDVAEYAIEGNDLVRARECLNAAADKIVDLGVTPPKRMTELEARLRSASV